MSLLSIESVSKSYFHRVILRDVSLRLNEGDRLGLIGTNGAGKTTLLRIINGQETTDIGRVVISKGRITGYLSQDTDTDVSNKGTALANKELLRLEHDMREAERKMAMMPDHGSKEYCELIREYAYLSASFEAMDGYSYERNLKEVLSGLELSERAFNTPVALLSGGEKMRVSLAHLLLRRPDILLLDEPTNHLDIAAMEWLENVLIKFKGALIIISHDRYFLDRVCNRTAELESGGLVVQSGNYSTFMAQKEVETEFAAKEAQRLEREIGRQSDIKQTMLSHRNMSGYHMKEKQIDKLSRQLSETRLSARREARAKIKFSLLKAEGVRNPDSVVIKTEGLGISFSGERIFSDISFEVCATDKIVIAGPNGCGKSTLLSIILGTQEEYEGEVQISPYSTYAYMGQKVSFRNEDLRIIDEIILRFGYTEGQSRSLLARFGFTDTDIFKQISVLSGGEKSRLYMACIMQENPEVILLDEPTNHLDIPSREILEKALNEFAGALVAVSHDRYFIDRCAKRLFGFTGNTLFEFDSYEDYRISERERKITVQEPTTDDRAADRKNTAISQADVRRNKAEIRKVNALRRDRIKFLEAEISGLEAKKADMEDSFASDTSPEVYREYSDLILLIEDRYTEYTRSTESTEDAQDDPVLN